MRTPAPPTRHRCCEVRDLHVEFHTRDGVAKAVNGVNYTVGAGETLAILGESGSGKSVTAQAIMGILDMPPGYDHRRRDPLPRPGPAARCPRSSAGKIRGPQIAMIFQDALSSLNPVLTVGYQLGEMFRVHRGMSRKDAKAKADRADGPGAHPGRHGSGSTTTRTSSPAACASAS